jgi:hypothetical protein
MAKHEQDERFEPGTILHQRGTSYPIIRRGGLFAAEETVKTRDFRYRRNDSSAVPGVCDMSEVNHLDAFWRYKVKPSTRARSALTEGKALVLSCSYALFQRAQSGILKYEEDLSGETGSSATLLRTHLADALANELEIRLIVAIPVKHTPSLEVPPAAPRPARTSFHAREDLVGRVTFFDGQRFVVEFRKAA